MIARELELLDRCPRAKFRLAELFLKKIDKIDCKVGFETSLILFEAKRGRFMILTATGSDIFGGQTNSYILVE